MLPIPSSSSRIALRAAPTAPLASATTDVLVDTPETANLSVALTIDDSVQNDALAAKDAELGQASAALTSMVCLVYIGYDLLRLD